MWSRYKDTLRGTFQFARKNPIISLAVLGGAATAIALTGGGALVATAIAGAVPTTAAIVTTSVLGAAASFGIGFATMGNSSRDSKTSSRIAMLGLGAAVALPVLAGVGIIATVALPVMAAVSVAAILPMAAVALGGAALGVKDKISSAMKSAGRWFSKLTNSEDKSHRNDLSPQGPSPRNDFDRTQEHEHASTFVASQRQARTQQVAPVASEQYANKRQHHTVGAEPENSQPKATTAPDPKIAALQLVADERTRKADRSHFRDQPSDTNRPNFRS